MNTTIQVHTETDKKHLLRIAREVGPIRTVYDIGALHALDGIELATELKASELHTFECNPPSFETCRQNLADHLPPTVVNHLQNLAISDREGEISFFPTDPEKTITPHPNGNPGASSLFLANGRYPNEQYVQSKITAQTTTLDRYCETHAKPDLLWIDVQGAEAMLLRGASRTLQHVKVIHMEVAFRAMYSGQALYWDTHPILRRAGFTLAHLDVSRWPRLPWLYSLLRFGPWLGNAIYVRA